MTLFNNKMNDRPFMVFSGQLRDNKDEGFDTSTPHFTVEKHNMMKLFNEYFM